MDDLPPPNIDTSPFRKGKNGDSYNWPAILEHAAAIVNSYDTGVTLRQLFYRLVAQGILENTKGRYTCLSKCTAEARRNGTFPDLIDLTRKLHRPATFEGPGDAQDWLRSIYRRDRTEGQKWSVYLGVEKNGLTSLLRSWFEDRGLPVFALGGYVSQSFVQKIQRDILQSGRPAVLLYGGDWDASGEDILRDFEERTGLFDETVRVALTQEQVALYELPPAMGKDSDSRSNGFKEKYGSNQQVELDALPPDTLRDLYEGALKQYFDLDAYQDSLAQEQEDLDALDCWEDG